MLPSYAQSKLIGYCFITVALNCYRTSVTTAVFRYLYNNNKKYNNHLTKCTRIVRKTRYFAWNLWAGINFSVFPSQASRGMGWGGWEGQLMIKSHFITIGTLKYLQKDSLLCGYWDVTSAVTSRTCAVAFCAAPALCRTEAALAKVYRQGWKYSSKIGSLS